MLIILKPAQISTTTFRFHSHLSATRSHTRGKKVDSYTINNSVHSVTYNMRVCVCCVFDQKDITHTQTHSRSDDVRLCDVFARRVRFSHALKVRNSSCARRSRAIGKGKGWMNDTNDRLYSLPLTYRYTVLGDGWAQNLSQRNSVATLLIICAAHI